jgi:hypothetical protein
VRELAVGNRKLKTKACFSSPPFLSSTKALISRALIFPEGQSKTIQMRESGQYELNFISIISAGAQKTLLCF